MSYEAVFQFLEATSENSSLQKELAGVIGAGDGNISSTEELDKEEAQALLGKRGVLVTAFAQNHGYIFTLSEFSAVISAFHQYQLGVISEADFTKVMGLDKKTQHLAKPLSALGKTVSMVFMGVKYEAEKDDACAHDVLEFMKKTSEDEEFRDALKQILNVGDGNISDFDEVDAEERQALTSERGALVAEFAAKHGYTFTLSDLLAVTDAFGRVQAGELTNEEFDRFLSLQVKSRDFFPFIEKVASMTFKGTPYSLPVVSKSNNNTLPVVRFMERTGKDPELRKQLVSILGGDGNISSPHEVDSEEAAALSGEMNNQVVSLGADYGYLFTISDLAAVLGAFKLVNEGELSLESCNRILGLGKKNEGEFSQVNNTAKMIYRGVRY